MTIKIVGSVRPCEPAMPDDLDEDADWAPRRWAGAVTDWHAGFELVLELGSFSILDEDSGAWAAARAAFDWEAQHGFGQVHVGDFEDEKIGRAVIGHRPDRSEVFILPATADVFLLGEHGQTVDRV